jgi:hypothetical protein
VRNTKSATLLASIQCRPGAKGPSQPPKNTAAQMAEESSVWMYSAM